MIFIACVTRLCHPCLSMDKKGSSNGKRFHKVGPNLYRDSIGRYYLLVKRAGKQFHRSLKTTARKLADRRAHEWVDGCRQVGDANVLAGGDADDIGAAAVRQPVE